MGNFINELWDGYSREESEILGKDCQESHLDELLAVLTKRLLELRMFLLNYKWKDEAEQQKFIFQQGPKFCTSYVFIVETKKIMEEKRILPSKFFNRFIKAKRQVMEMFYLRYHTLEKIIQLEYSLTSINIFEQLFLEEKEIVVESNIKQIFSHLSILLGTMKAYKKLISIHSKKLNKKYNDVDRRKDSIGNLQWTDSAMSLTEIAYALKYSGAVNKGNVDVKEIAEVLGRAFNTKPVNVYRNKQDLYSRKNQSMFLDKLRKDFIKGLEESDHGNFS